MNLKDAVGNWQGDKNIAQIAKNYFRDIFKAFSPTSLNKVMDTINPKVTDSMNINLLAPFKADEVKSTIFSMSPHKAPGVDGFHANFFQKYWNIIGDNVIEVILDFLNKGSDIKNINVTRLILIPKYSNLKNMTHFRPISLCNVFHKIISKVLANRLKFVLPDVIFLLTKVCLSPIGLLLITFLSLMKSSTPLKGKEREKICI